MWTIDLYPLDHIYSLILATTCLQPNIFCLMPDIWRLVAQALLMVSLRGTLLCPTNLSLSSDSRHRIDAVTIYCPNASGPHGFHSLGKTVESTLRSFNNLLERPHASYFFYLLPRPDKFIPVGNYLPAAILLGASITLGGFDIPTPIQGVAAIAVALLLGCFGFTGRASFIALVGYFTQLSSTTSTSALSLLHLICGAAVPTLAMVNFPQAILWAYLTIPLLYLAPGKSSLASVIVVSIAMVAVYLPDVRPFFDDLWLESEELGNAFMGAVFTIFVPLVIIIIAARKTSPLYDWTCKKVEAYIT